MREVLNILGGRGGGIVDDGRRMRRIYGTAMWCWGDGTNIAFGGASQPRMTVKSICCRWDDGEGERSWRRMEEFF
jgi:hypothetical protein